MILIDLSNRVLESLMNRVFHQIFLLLFSVWMKLVHNDGVKFEAEICASEDQEDAAGG